MTRLTSFCARVGCLLAFLCTHLPAPPQPGTAAPAKYRKVPAMPYRPVATFRIETRRHLWARTTLAVLAALVAVNLPSPARALWRADHHEVIVPVTVVHEAHLNVARTRFVDVGDVNADGVDEYEPAPVSR